jgi:hypothetical protein
MKFTFNSKPIIPVFILLLIFEIQKYTSYEL